MKGTITNLQSTEKLWIFSIKGSEYAAPKSKLKETLMDGFEIEFTETITKGKDKGDGSFWPDTRWANSITIIGDGGPESSTPAKQHVESKGTMQFKADPDKQRSIERQSAVKSAVDFYSERGGSTIEDVLNAAAKFSEFIKS